MLRKEGPNAQVRIVRAVVVASPPLAHALGARIDRRAKAIRSLSSSIACRILTLASVGIVHALRVGEGIGV